MKRLKPATLAFIAAAAVILVAGFFAGRSLHSSSAETFVFDLSAPVYEAGISAIAESKGGFTGFGETAGLSGRTVLSGRVVALAGPEVTLEDSSGTRHSVRLTTPVAAVSRIEAAGRDALRTGATVIVRHESGSDSADAVLILEAP
jgi:hypothetical protein